MNEKHHCVYSGSFTPPIILNTGETICGICARQPRQPFSQIKMVNEFMSKYLRLFSVNDLLKSLDKIAYMEQYAEIELDDPEKLIKNRKFSLNFDEFKVFVDKCVNLECTSEYNRRLIHIICELGDINMLLYLASKNVELDCADKFNNRPLHSACNGNNPEMVKYLVSKGVNLNSIDDLGRRPTHITCSKGCRNSMIVFDNPYAVVTSPLHSDDVCNDCDKSLEIVKCLVENGADFNCGDIFERTPMHYACIRGNHALQLVKYLEAKGADTNRVARFRQHTIQLACSHGDNGLEIVKHLVSNGADVNCVDESLRRPIHHTIRKYYTLQLINFLVICGADINCADELGQQIIHLACYHGDDGLEIVKYLLANGANVNCTDENGLRPIHCACWKGDGSLRLIEYLIANGAEVKCADECGRLPIDYVSSDALELIKFLTPMH
jgi:ankyrin repeat protein